MLQSSIQCYVSAQLLVMSGQTLVWSDICQIIIKELYLVAYWLLSILLFQGDIQLKRKDFESAISSYSKAMELAPLTSDMLVRRARALIQLHRSVS